MIFSLGPHRVANSLSNCPHNHKNNNAETLPLQSERAERERERERETKRTKKCCTQVHLKCIYINIMMRTRTRTRTKFVWPQVCGSIVTWPAYNNYNCISGIGIGIGLGTGWGRIGDLVLRPMLSACSVNAIDRSDSFEVVFGVFLVQDLALFSNTHTHSHTHTPRPKGEQKRIQIERSQRRARVDTL